MKVFDASHPAVRVVPVMPAPGHEVLLPAEVRALAEIVETGDILEHGDETYLLARVSPATIDALSAFWADREDLEPDVDREPKGAEPNGGGSNADWSIR